jgi:hypothetical protein
MDEGLQILAIAPAADGWRAVLLDADDNKPRGYPVLCWALVREPYEDGSDVGATTFVAPVIAELGANMPNGTVLACSLDGFVGLAGPGEDPTDIAQRNGRVAELELASIFDTKGGQA